MQLLLARGADKDTRDKARGRAVNIALRWIGLPRALRVVLRAPCTARFPLACAAPQEGHTPLICAVDCGNLEVVQARGMRPFPPQNNVPGHRGRATVLTPPPAPPSCYCQRAPTWRG